MGRFRWRALGRGETKGEMGVEAAMRRPRMSGGTHRPGDVRGRRLLPTRSPRQGEPLAIAKAIAYAIGEAVVIWR